MHVCLCVCARACACACACVYIQVICRLQAAWRFCPVMLLSEVIDAVPGRAGKTGRRGEEGLIRKGLREEEQHDILLSFLHLAPPCLPFIVLGPKPESVCLLALSNLPKPLSSKHKPLLSIPVSPTTPPNIHTHSLSTTSHHECIRGKERGAAIAVLSFFSPSSCPG